MNYRPDRRQFLQGVAVTTAATAPGCHFKSHESSTAPESSSSSAASSDFLGPTSPSQSNGETTDAAASAEDTLNSSGRTSAASGATNATVSADTSNDAASAGASDSATSNPASHDTSQATNPPQLTSPLGVALLGLGNYSSGQLALALQLTEHCRLVGIVTGTPSKAATWQEQYAIADKNVYSYDNLSELINNPDIHVVYIVTPNHVHANFAIQVARAKKHVWLEKPMAMNVEECQRIIDACRENGVQLCIGYRLQHEPNTQTVVEYATSKPFGAVQEVDALAGFAGFGPADAAVWRLNRAMGGGALYDMGVYSINAARYATGEEPIRVRNATQWTERPELFTEVDEWTEFELDFPSGAVAFCRTSFGEKLDALEIRCVDGSYRLSPMQAYTGVSGETSDGTLLNQTIHNQQAKQMDDDALAIIEGRAVLVPGEEGLRDVRIVLAIQQAASSGQSVEL